MMNKKDTCMMFEFDKKADEIAAQNGNLTPELFKMLLQGKIARAQAAIAQQKAQSN